GRVMAEAVASLREYPKESFFGLGPDSRREDLTRFALRTPEVAGRAGVRVLPAVLAGGGIGVLSPRTNEGTTDFVRSSGFVEVDYRQPLNARRGGWYRLDVSQFSDRAGGTWSFRRTDLDLRQYFGFLADRRVIALRGYVSSSDASEGSLGVPFYLMPTLGGNDTLRGFRNYRFRGPHAMLLQAEYRWELWSGLDAALFYDAGKVEMQRSDLNFKRLEDDYGFGFRFNTANGVIMRVDAAFGSRDGKHLHIVFGGVF
ncbi:MAG TPA: BamA/TamA family outer membrane protein, partial [Vicinamibacterales bacterium]